MVSVVVAVTRPRGSIPGDGNPDGTAGFVAPIPARYSVRISPGCAGCAASTNEASVGRWAITLPVPSAKSASPGDSGTVVIFCGSVRAPFALTTAEYWRLGASSLGI